MRVCNQSLQSVAFQTNNATFIAGINNLIKARNLLFSTVNVREVMNKQIK